MIRLRIRKLDEDHITLEALEGIDHFGFGTFLCNLKPEEVDCDEFSKTNLMAALPKVGLNGVEIWSDNRLAWGDPSEAIVMPVKEISNLGANEWLAQIVCQ